MTAMAFRLSTAKLIVAVPLFWLIAPGVLVHLLAGEMLAAMRDLSATKF